MGFTASAVSPHELEPACRLLASFRLPGDRDRAAERYRDLFTHDKLDPAGLFVARDEQGTLRGAMLVQTMPGALGLAWPPVASSRRNRTVIEDVLVPAACRWLQYRGVKVCQVFAGEAESTNLAALERHGFRRVTELVDMTHNLDSVVDPDTRLTVEPISPATRDAFAATLLDTFEGSLDCPEVAGSRTDTELLDSYAGSITRQHWYLVQQERKAIGVLLLDGADEAGAFELTYVGIAPNFRNRGCGAELVKFALFQAKNAGAGSLVLSVDIRNEPALHLYRTHGFQASGARQVFLAEWPAIS